MRTGGQILIDQLALEGVRHIFTVPGESFLAALDALHDHPTIAPVTCRNEGGSAIMAQATGKLTGRPGVALVTRGPGAANAVPGVYIAFQDATPMVLLVGLPPRAHEGRPAFQAIDIAALFAPIAKWIAVVPNAGRIAEHIQRGFQIAMSGHAGPVVIGLPEDILYEATCEDTVAPEDIETSSPTPARLAALHFLLEGAERPLILAGTAAWTSDAAVELAYFAERFDIPVVTSFRNQDHIDNRHPCYAGHAGLAMDPAVAAAIRECDLLIAIGDALTDISTNGFTLVKPHIPDQKLVRISPDPGRDGVYHASLDIPASPARAVKVLSGLPLPAKARPWKTWRRDLRAAYEASLKPMTTPGSVCLAEVIATLSRVLPDDAIVTNGAGNYAGFLHKYFVYKSYPSQLAPTAGSMGYGLPAAIAAKLAFPTRTVIALAGDGCFQMTGQELQTAVQFGVPIVIIVANNAALGTIRMHQERRYPGRVVATSLINPDFVALAASAGATGERVTTQVEFAPAIERALAAGRPALIELMLDTDAITPGQTIADLRAASISANSKTEEINRYK